MHVARASKGKCKLGRTGKQSRLKENANDDKVSTALKGEIKRDTNEIKLEKRRNRRVPQGYNLAHRRCYEVRRGYGYEYSNFQTIRSSKAKLQSVGVSLHPPLIVRLTYGTFRGSLSPT
ncbi:polymorphic toxin type 8 domain-containing protein [Salipaludibacillus sp. LMS25]|jgi:hypothetical protein|uniref:polymorphic toxin type 8 domain-containing protein n=1 Tax=Salipaludibacillus sp. LMS25 TaxID=2924031 RepID=UPI0034E9686D